jgi:hypothetical protein
MLFNDNIQELNVYNDNIQELQVIESKRNAIRKGLAFELFNAQDAVLCSYFAQRAEAGRPPNPSWQWK